MALIRCIGGTGAGTGNASIFASTASGNLTNSNSGTNTVTYSTTSGIGQIACISTGAYNTLTFSGVTTYVTAYGIKVDGTKETINPTGNVYDLTGYVLAVISFDPVTGSTTLTLS